MMSATSSCMGRKVYQAYVVQPQATPLCLSVLRFSEDPGALVIIKKGEKSEGLPVLECNVSEILSSTIVRF